LAFTGVGIIVICGYIWGKLGDLYDAIKASYHRKTSYHRNEMYNFSDLVSSLILITVTYHVKEEPFGI
jgi:hypothetical protein